MWFSVDVEGGNKTVHEWRVCQIRLNISWNWKLLLVKYLETSLKRKCLCNHLAKQPRVPTVFIPTSFWTKNKLNLFFILNAVLYIVKWILKNKNRVKKTHSKCQSLWSSPTSVLYYISKETEGSNSFPVQLGCCSWIRNRCWL